MADQSIGIMEGAFFVSKNEILSWMNNLLQLNLTRIEQLGTGAAYCQVVDAMFPGKVKMNRVNWRARNEWEFIVNFKILQQAFEKCNIKKHIDIERLSKARYQDNLEFAQWFKRFYETNAHRVPADYQPAEVRQKNAQAEGATSGGVDFSFVEFRDAPRKNMHHQQQAHAKERSYEESADSRLPGGGASKNTPSAYAQSLISRSKSPIIKNLSNAPLLYSKSRELSLSKHAHSNANFILEHATLIQKFREIDEILQREGLQESERVEKVRAVVDQAKALGLLGGENTHGVHQYTRPHAGSLHSASQHQQQQQQQQLYQQASASYASGGGGGGGVDLSPDALAQSNVSSKRYAPAGRAPRSQKHVIHEEEGESPRPKNANTEESAKDANAQNGSPGGEGIKNRSTVGGADVAASASAAGGGSGDASVAAPVPTDATDASGKASGVNTIPDHASKPSSTKNVSSNALNNSELGVKNKVGKGEASGTSIASAAQKRVTRVGADKTKK